MMLKSSILVMYHLIKVLYSQKLYHNYFALSYKMNNHSLIFFIIFTIGKFMLNHKDVSVGSLNDNRSLIINFALFKIVNEQKKFYVSCFH